MWRYVIVGLVAGFFTIFIGESPARAAETYSIYFDSQSSTLSVVATKIVGLAKNAIKSSAKVTIVGHSDAAEDDANGLSLKRAAAVKKALIKAGISAKTTIKSLGKGISEPASKQPGDSEAIAHARNRNTVITIQ